MNDKTMNDETTEILKTFQEYSDTFAQKNVCALLRFYGYPALMVDRDEKPKVLSNSIIAAIGLFLAIQKLKKLNYKCSKLHTLEAKQVHQNLAIVSGTATRHDTEGIEFDKFGFTYTLRKTGEYWKIIAGIIHDKEKFLPL
jgi:ketosteroid isomerase-like protein